MLVNNAGGSITSALLLTLLAWGARWLRTELIKKKQQDEAAKQQTCHTLGRFYAPLSPAALRMLVETGAYPHLVFDVRAAAQSPLPGELRGALRLPEKDVGGVLSQAAAWAGRFQGVPHPPPHYMLVFVGDNEEEQLRAAAVAASCSYARSMVLAGALPQFGAGLGAPDLQFIGRDALALLLGLTNEVVQVPRATLLDVRRGDERALFGSIRGAAHLPLDQLPSALGLGPDQFAAQYHFPKPGPEDLVVMQCRTSTRSAWAAQLAKDAGLQRCLVYRQGVVGWRLDPAVKPYRGYSVVDAPPEPEPFTLEPVSSEAGRRELSSLGVPVRVLTEQYQ